MKRQTKTRHINSLWQDNSRTTEQATGFTLVEMLIVAPMVILVIGVFISAIIGMTGEVMTTRSRSVIGSDVQTAIGRIKQDIASSDAFLATNNVALTSPQGYNNDTTTFNNVSSSYDPMLILNTQATSSNPLSTTQSYIYSSNQPYQCGSANVTQNTPLMVNIVYFVKNGTLWRRVIANSNFATAGCNKPWQQTSCADGQVGGMCMTKDEKMVDNIAAGGFNISYYPSISSSTANTTAVDATQSANTRQVALQKTQAASVTIAAVTTVAGKEVSESRSVSASRRPNGYIKSQTITTQPSNINIIEGASTSFSAASSNTTSTIQWQASTNMGDSWFNINNDATYGGVTTGTLTVATTVSTTDELMDGYMYRAVFTNGLDIATSSPATLNVYSTALQTMSLQNSWIDYDTNYNSASYYKSSAGVVSLRGLIKKASGSTSVGEIITTLPKSYWPKKHLIFIVASNSNTARVDIKPNGEVISSYGCNIGWVSLENIHYIPNNGQYTPTKIPLVQNGWKNFSTYYSPPSYNIDSLGRVHMHTTMLSGTTTEGTTIFGLPASLAPSSSLVAANSGGATGPNFFAQFGISTSANVVAKGFGGSYMSMMLMYYPSSAAPSWQSLTLGTNWSYYGAPYATAECIKSADGLVSLKGIVKNSSAPASNTILATLPAACGKPAKRVLFITTSAAAYSRVDIANDGTIRFMVGTPATWISLDGLTFYADL